MCVITTTFRCHVTGHVAEGGEVRPCGTPSDTRTGQRSGRSRGPTAPRAPPLLRGGVVSRTARRRLRCRFGGSALGPRVVPYTVQPSSVAIALQSVVVAPKRAPQQRDQGGSSWNMRPLACCSVAVCSRHPHIALVKHCSVKIGQRGLSRVNPAQRLFSAKKGLVTVWRDHVKIRVVASEDNF